MHLRYGGGRPCNSAAEITQAEDLHVFVKQVLHLFRVKM